MLVSAPSKLLVVAVVIMDGVSMPSRRRGARSDPAELQKLFFSHIEDGGFRSLSSLTIKLLSPQKGSVRGPNVMQNMDQLFQLEHCLLSQLSEVNVSLIEYSELLFGCYAFCRFFVDFVNSVCTFTGLFTVLFFIWGL